MNGKYISTLTIAGSDSCGGAGLQADIKTMSALGCYASSVVTAVTAQDTCRVGSVMDVPAEIVREQVHMVLNDIRPQAVKTGMMSNADIVGAVAGELRAYGPVPLVVDPVMVATSGDALMRRGTLDVLVSDLLPLATLVTPNIPEAAALTGMPLHSDDDLWVAARRILSFGCHAVLIKAAIKVARRRPTDCLPPTAARPCSGRGPLTPATHMALAVRSPQPLPPI